MKKNILILALFFTSVSYAQQPHWLGMSENKRFFVTQDGKPFFWLGDTGWLLFIKCNREETLHYLDIRKQQGFNVIQVMVLHTLSAKTVYGAGAIESNDVSTPIVTAGNNINEPGAYDYWDHVEWVVQEAAKRGIYMALVPVWGSNVKEGKVSATQATIYGKFLAERFKNYSNIIWLNGGDIMGSDHKEVWEALGKTIKKYDARHLMTYHPRGRYTSSDWFLNESWLDFNMFQSGHRKYAQDTSSLEKHRFGEDNWKYVVNDYALKPTKPTLDGEPSYEHIPEGLHDSLNRRWNAADIRRYAYWSVFAGAAGFTYGDNAVMQFHTMGEKGGAYGVRENWKDDIYAPGAQQMHFLKSLMLSKDYFSRIPAQQIVLNNSGKQYEYLLATKGKDYAMVYTFIGKNFSIDASKLDFKANKAKWFKPADGSIQNAKFKKKGNILSFNPPGKKERGNDWVLIIEN